MRGTLAVALLTACLASCLPRARFRCDEDADCAGLVGGRCEPNHVCSATDARCPVTGRRYARFDDGVATVANACVLPPCGAEGIRRLRAGAGHACLLRGSGAVLCWGRNEAGQLGDGTTAPRSTPTPVVGLSGVTDVVDLALGEGHTCALRSTGVALCWGRNEAGQLGDGTRDGRAVPGPVLRLREAVQLAAGTSSTCARTRAGQVFCWGSNAQGQLGADAPLGEVRDVPVTVRDLIGTSDLALSAGHACVVDEGRGVRCWGGNAFGQLGDGSISTRPSPVAVAGELRDVVEVATGTLHTCARRFDGSVSCWGGGNVGQLGDGGTQRRALPGPVALAPGVTLASLRAGAQHVCGIGVDESLWCWGGNLSGQLGDGTTSSRPVPQALALAGVLEVAAGDGHTCARTRDGFVSCWGDDRSGQVGVGAPVALASAAVVTGLGGASAVAAGSDHTCAIAGDGSVSCWGAGAGGRLGRGVADRGDDSSSPVRVDAPIPFAAVAGGDEHTCGLTSAGEVWCWGRGNLGQLGPGVGASSTPVPVAGIAGAVEIVAGAAHTCARVGDRVTCWGFPSDGRLGGADAVASPELPAAAVGLAAGGAHTCARLVDGRVVCWGRSTDGQLGDVLVAPPGPGGGSGLFAPTLPMAAASIAAGAAHTCARLVDGRVACWGRGTEGQLGTGEPTSSAAPRLLQSLTPATALVAGARHTCALVAHGRAFCWGDGAAGQLGTGALGSAVLPVAVRAPALRSLAAGRVHVCGVLGDGGVACWGGNTFGQLGTGHPLLRPSPRPIALVCP